MECMERRDRTKDNMNNDNEIPKQIYSGIGKGSGIMKEIFAVICRMNDCDVRQLFNVRLSNHCREDCREPSLTNFHSQTQNTTSRPSRLLIHVSCDDSPAMITRRIVLKRS